MVRYRFFAVSLATAALASLPAFGACGSDDIHVPRDYATIGEAVQAAEPGATVVVAPGTYAEIVELDQAITLSCEGDGGAVIDGGGGRHVVHITASDVEVKACSLRNAWVGFDLEGAGTVRLLENRVSDLTFYGVAFFESLPDAVIRIEGNEFSRAMMGIYSLWDWTGARYEIVGNDLHDNTHGIWLDSTAPALVEGNLVHDNLTAGIMVNWGVDDAIRTG
jgi:nitrous oxidase accessory protein